MHLPFAKALKSAKPVANAPHLPFANSLQQIGKHTAFAREEGASYCKKSKPTTVKDSITLVTGGGSKTDIGASAPVLPPPSFSTRQVFILTNNFK
jgi:hypothetical protein